MIYLVMVILSIHLTHNANDSILYSTNNQSDYDKIVGMAQDVAGGHEYKYGVYDCTQFSQELVKRLNASGYNSYCQPGFYKKGTFSYPHTWVGLSLNNKTIYIEATNGQIIDNETLKRDYRKMGNRRFCW